MRSISTLRLRLFSRAIALSMALSIPSLVYAQNCPLCYTQAAGAGARVIQALRSGILVLVIPPMLICIGIAIMAYKKRNQFNESESAASEESGSLLR